MKKLNHKIERLAWKNAKDRCLNPNHQAWKNYGGRGIEFHGPWVNDFDAFFAEIGPRNGKFDLDRIDNERGYVPGNLRWATRSENTRNKRLLKCHVDYLKRNNFASLHEAAGKTGVEYATLIYRIRKDFSDELVKSSSYSEQIIEARFRQRKSKYILKNGQDMKAACRERGISASTVFKRLQYGYTIDEACANPFVQRISRVIKITPSDTIKIKSMRKDGHTIDEIAKRFKVCASAIKGHIKKEDMGQGR